MKTQSIFDSARFWLIMSALSGALFVLLIKYYAISEKTYLLPIIVVFGGLFESYCYYRVFTLKEASIGYAISRGLSVIIAIILFVIFFHDKISTLTGIGIILIVIGIICLHN